MSCDVQRRHRLVFQLDLRRRELIEMFVSGRLKLIQPGKPTQNAYIESFNGKFRDECLNEHRVPGS